MKKIFISALILMNVAPFIATGAQTPAGDIVQFNNLVVQSVSGTSAPAEIIAYEDSAITNCLKFGATNGSGKSSACPASPIVQPQKTYRVQAGDDTILLLRDRQSAHLSDFSQGDKINVYGFYNNDGAIRALTVRDLSKPLERRDAQFNNVEVAGIASDGTVITVIQAPDFPCYKFSASGKSSVFPCPLGLGSFSDRPRTKNMPVPQNIQSRLGLVRKYEVHVSSQTIILDRNKSAASFSMIAVGDKLNIFGASDETGLLPIEAEVIRDLSKPVRPPQAERFDGIITQVNSADGSFVLRTRGGDLITVQNPVQPDSFVSVRGIYDENTKILSNISDITLKNKAALNAIPIISMVNPGSGPVGTVVTINGSGFTPTENSINFAGVNNAVVGLKSPNGKTLTFNIPATPCSPGSVCPQVVIQPGFYDISVTNVNGTSNVSSFQIGNSPQLSITTESLPQAMQNKEYKATVNAYGGTDSYAWSVSGGTLPPGLSLVPSICVAYPCKVPVSIAGTPPTPGTYPLTITLKSGGESVSRDFKLVVVEALSSGGY